MKSRFVIKLYYKGIQFSVESKKRSDVMNQDNNLSLVYSMKWIRYVDF